VLLVVVLAITALFWAMVSPTGPAPFRVTLPETDMDVAAGAGEPLPPPHPKMNSDMLTNKKAQIADLLKLTFIFSILFLIDSRLLCLANAAYILIGE
jgi:hypothetical protein